ncbi:MAG: hypothetical protein CMF22_10415 [Idiomarinaceae bacterium]|nr:hypothetical protein [Idiomarinaceae bacterium]MBG23854.1 hypothetical protein [Idiomarinaceae bacterium]|tara:strand:+ start:18971 stop:19330 length:360 start_codon:yes stop_codon:yes gene_type:complete
MAYLSTITAAEREELRLKGAEKREEKRIWAEANLKLEWDDHSHWRDLASKYGYRMPNKHEPCGSKHTNRFLRKFGLSKEWYQDHTGFKNANEEFRVNPTLPAFAAVGFLLEAYDEEQQA